MIRLVQEFGAHAGRKLSFDKERVRVGRAPENDIVFDSHVDLDASARHCEILREHDAWSVVDLQSRNGTFVNGSKVQRQRLASNDLVECGRGGPRLRVTLEVTVSPRGGTLAVPPAEIVAAQASAVTAAPTPPLEKLPAAAVGRKTLALMIEQAVSAHAKRNRGLTVAVGTLSVLVLASLGVGGWLLWDREQGPRGERSNEPLGGGDPSSAGSRLAAANEANIYLLAVVGAGATRARGFCTAFAISRDLLATNAHCVNAARAEVQRGNQVVALRNKSNGSQLAVTAVYLDARYRDPRHSRGGTGYDIGLFRAGVALPSWVRLARREELEALHEGDGIFVYGFPGLTMNESSPVATITLGLVNRLTDFFDAAAPAAECQKFLHSAQTSGGSSGSPIFLASGPVVGLNAGSLADDERQVVTDPTNGQRREVEVNRGSNFKYGMRADLLRSAAAAVGETLP